MNQLRGLQRSKFSTASSRGQKVWVSGTATSGLLLENGPTCFTTEANQVAIIDALDVITTASDAAAANRIVSLVIGSTKLTFVIRTVSGQNRQRFYRIRPKGTLVIPPSTAVSATADTALHAGDIGIRYRLMPVTQAIQAGYYSGTPWAVSSGSISVANTAQDITGFTASDVTTSRALEINGICITGGMSSATSASNLEIMLEFYNGTTSRKIIKGLYASAVPEVTNATIIDNCVIRGPVGYGLRVTAGQTGTGCQIALWGKYITAVPGGGVATHPSATGVIPGASDAVDLGEYFWLHSEATATGFYEFFPATTLSASKDSYVIDGYNLAVSAAGSAAGLLGIGQAVSPFQAVTVPLPSGLGGAGVGTSAVMTDSDASIQMRLADRIGFQVANLAGTVSKTSMLVWGRCGSRSTINDATANNLSKRFGGGT